MASNLTAQQISDITNNLSILRMSRFHGASGFSPKTDSLEIYTWNALVSGAFISSLHICEVSIRNGISGALERVYGSNWPWNTTFIGSLPHTSGVHFNPRNELIKISNQISHGATGKVIAELKMAFWCHMLTSRYDARIWNPYLRNEFPFMPPSLTIADCRLRLHQNFNALRAFRNRIAHHEYIFTQPLSQHHDRIKKLVRWRCQNSAFWLSQWETVTTTLKAKPN